MKLGIMQPYFMPYIGYWQLMNAVDEYVIYDDVNFIKGGWINRNRILVNGQAQYFNVPMLGASSFKQIREINVNHEARLVEKNLRTL
ncbi:MAG: WbqC family protein, partial [Ruthenibacterium sp.]